MSTQKLRTIARRVRRYLQAVAAESGDVDSDLNGYCGRAAAILHRELHRAGLPSEIVAVDGHAFVKSGEYVVDVTATQFREYMPYTAIRHEDKIPRWMWWWAETPYAIHGNSADWIDRQIQDGWPMQTVASAEDFEAVRKY